MGERQKKSQYLYNISQGKMTAKRRSFFPPLSSVFSPPQSNGGVNLL